MEDVRSRAKSLIRKIKAEPRLIHYCSFEIVHEAAYWRTHPTTLEPAHSPKHAQRIKEGSNGWEVEFGANTFLAERAIVRCLALVEEALDSPTLNHDALSAALARAIQGSVCDYLHEEYHRYDTDENGFMLFGTQAIHVPTAVHYISKKFELRQVAQGE